MADEKSIDLDRQLEYGRAITTDRTTITSRGGHGGTYAYVLELVGCTEETGQMVRKGMQGIRAWALVQVWLGVLLGVVAWTSGSQAATPIRIGFGMALTGGLAANGKAALLAMEIWRDEVNKN